MGRDGRRAKEGRSKRQARQTKSSKSADSQEGRGLTTRSQYQFVLLERHNRACSHTVRQKFVFRTRDFNVNKSPPIRQVPRTSPATSCEIVLAMNPLRYNWQTKVPSLLIDMVSFKSPTVPCQRPIVFGKYSVRGTGGELFAQDARQNTRTAAAIALTQGVQRVFMRGTPFIFF
jgi:hypothetical protein